MDLSWARDDRPAADNLMAYIALLERALTLISRSNVRLSESVREQGTYEKACAIAQAGLRADEAALAEMEDLLR